MVWLWKLFFYALCLAQAEAWIIMIYWKTEQWIQKGRTNSAYSYILPASVRISGNHITYLQAIQMRRNQRWRSWSMQIEKHIAIIRWTLNSSAQQQDKRQQPQLGTQDEQIFVTTVARCMLRSSYNNGFSWFSSFCPLSSSVFFFFFFDHDSSRKFFSYHQ